MVKKEISKYKVDKPKEIFEHEIVAFSYFFDRAVDAGMIGMFHLPIFSCTNSYVVLFSDICIQFFIFVIIYCLDESTGGTIQVKDYKTYAMKRKYGLFCRWTYEY